MQLTNESPLQLRNLVKQLFEAAHQGDLILFKSVATEFCYKSSNIEPEISNSHINNTNGVTNGKGKSSLNYNIIGPIRDANGASLLHISAAGCNIEIIKLLMDKYSDLINSVDNSGQSPLFYSLKNQNPIQIDVINLLLPFSDINKCDNDGNSLLHIAIKYSNISTIRLLIDNGCKINTVSSIFGTPINTAVITENLEIIKLLVEKGGDVNLSASKVGGPPPSLVYSSAAGNTDIVKYLLENGCCANETDANGWSALHCAAESGHFEILQLLINAGADVNYSNQNATAYHLALNTKNQQLITYLHDLTDQQLTKQIYTQLPLEDAIKLSSDARNKGKQFVQSKKWQDAKSIYLKTINTLQPLANHETVKNELSVLYSNLSYACLSLGEPNAALSAGLKSIEYNKKWIKGHYTTAMAYKNLGDNANYLCYLFDAAKLEGEGGPLWEEFKTNAERIKQLQQSKSQF